MRSTIRNIRQLLAHPDPTDAENETARSELMWASAMAENGILKLGKTTDFQCHMIEHQLGAYTDCNHGQGLAVLHPAFYRHIYKNAPEKFERFARQVWEINTSGLSAEDAAAQAIDALADFIKETGLPTSLSEKNIFTTITCKSCNLNDILCQCPKEQSRY